MHQRQNTIERVATEVVRRQEGFLRHGVQQLKPMKMQDIADAVGVHISTISRATSGKYIQTPQGIFDMKRFFSSGTMSDDGAMVSQQAIKDTLRQIVDAEDKDSPFSDDQLGRGPRRARLCTSHDARSRSTARRWASNRARAGGATRRPDTRRARLWA